MFSTNYSKPEAAPSEQRQGKALSLLWVSPGWRWRWEALGGSISLCLGGTSRDAQGSAAMFSPCESSCHWHKRCRKTLSKALCPSWQSLGFATHWF